MRSGRSEEGPGSAGWSSGEDPPGREPKGGQGSLVGLAGTLGHSLSWDRGVARQGVKRRIKVVEVFCSEDAAEKLLYLVLSQLDET